MQATTSIFAPAPVGPALNAILAQTVFSNDLDVFNYALTLEHLEYAFYRDGLRLYSVDDFVAAGYDEVVYEYFELIRDHEDAHVNVIVDTIVGAGGEPVREAEYDFGYNDVVGFIGIAAVLENVGVQAYTGAAASISDPGLLTAALTIHGIEARHASYLNLLVGESPFPASFETALAPDDVLAAAGGFIVADEATPDSETSAEVVEGDSETIAEVIGRGGETETVTEDDSETIAEVIGSGGGTGTGGDTSSDMNVASMPSTGAGPQVAPTLRDRW